MSKIGQFGWYEGFSWNNPSTNNGLERKNLELKQLYTLRKRLPFSQFTLLAERIVEDWSNEIYEKPASTSPTIPLATFDKAYDLKRQISAKTRACIRYKSDYFIFPAKNTKEIRPQDYRNWHNKIILNQFETWDEYKEERLRFHAVNIPNDYSCTCVMGCKFPRCKHSAFVLAHLGLIDYPESSKSQPIDVKRKKGRPKKARHALIRD